MATQKNNTVVYEFQGNVLPLEKAFAQVGKLFRRYIREAKQAAIAADPLGNPKGVLGKDEQDIIKTMKHYYKRLKVYSDKVKSGSKLKPDEEKEASKIYKKLLTKAKVFYDMRNKLQRAADKELKKQEEHQEQVKDWTAVSTQFRAGVQAEQLQILSKSIPGLPAKVIADINSYIEAWKRAKAEFNGSAESAENLTAATKNLDQKAREYAATLKTLAKNQKSTTNAMEHMLRRVINMISSFEWWYRIIRDGVSLLGDYVESLNFIQVAINNIKWSSLVDGAEESSKALTKLTADLNEARWALGLNATDTNTAAATYISFANAMNMTGESVTKFGQNMTQLSIDMASLYNKDVIVMMTALRSGLAGNTRALMNYGMSVHDATLNEWMMSKGLKKSMTNLSETSQMMVRYMYIMEKTTAAQGDLARTIKSPANQLRILRTQLKLLMQNLAALFNVFIYPAIRLLNEILIPLNAFLSALTSLSDSNYSSAIGTTGDAFDDLADSIDNVSNAAKGLSALDEINQMTDSKKARIGIDVDIQAMFDAIDVYKSFNRETSELTKVMEALGNALAPIWQMISDSSILDGIAWALNAIGYALKPVQLIMQGIKENFESLPSWLQTILGFLVKLNGVVLGLGTTILVASAAVTVFKTVLNSGIFSTFLKTLKAMVVTFGSFIKQVALAITTVLKWIATQIKAIAVNISNAVSAWVAEKAYWKLALAIIAAAGMLAGIVAASIATAVLIGKATQDNNESKSKPSGGYISSFATGGIVTGPTFALIGEGKYNEAVVPLGNSPQMKELQQGIANTVVHNMNYSNNNVSSGNTSVNLVVDGRSLGRASINNIGLTRRQVGVDIK